MPEFNPNVFAAKVRNVVLKIGLGLGGLVLARDLFRLLVTPGKWVPWTLDGRFDGIAKKIQWPGILDEIAILRVPLDWLKGIWLFIALPIAGILAVALIYFLYNYVIVPVFHWVSRVLLLVWGAFTGGPKRRRHIIVCIDGTWNYPDNYEGGVVATSNVFQFWDNLRGKRSTWRELTVGAGRIKLVSDAKEQQIGLYYPGVGNPATYSSLGAIVGGAFGFGAANIREEAYRDLIRFYRSDKDKITVVGFSRGAAIARLLATYVEQQGVPHLTLSDTKAGKFVVGIARTVFPGWKWIQKREVKVDFLGIWDTVGSFGISKNVLGIPFQRIDLFKDMNVSSCVGHVVHCLALDEQRDSFLPTLVEPPKPRPDGTPIETEIEEVWFPGVHANVGGGFANDGLARIGLEYMTRKFLEHYDRISLPVQVKEKTFGDLEENLKSRVRSSGSALYEMEPREIPVDAKLHSSIVARMKSTELEDDHYCPPNVLDLLDRLAEKKKKLLGSLEYFHAQDANLVSDAEFQAAKAKIERDCRVQIES